MNWPALLVSVVLVAPVVAYSQQPPAANLTGNTVTLRACVQQGMHGSPAGLSQIEVVAPGGAIETPRVLYWFAKNLDGFRTYTGSLVEIVAAISQVIAGPLELKASDGVFAEVFAAARNETGSDPGARTVATAGNTAVPGAGADRAPDAGELPVTIVKAEVTRLRMLGQCR